MAETITEAEIRERISFHLDWAAVDATVDPFLHDLAPKEIWLRWEQEGAVEGIFFHTVSAGHHAITCAFAHDLLPLEHRDHILAQGLTLLSLSPPYDRLPLQAALLAQMAFDAIHCMAGPARRDRQVSMEDLPVRPEMVDPRHFIAATEAAFGFTLTVLTAYEASKAD